MKKYWGYVVFYFLLSCHQRPDTIKIIGNVKNIPVSKVYLADAYRWEEKLDSAVYKDERFIFELDTSKIKEPFLASLFIIDSNKRIRQLQFINYIKTTPKATFSNSGFFLTKGINHIEGDFGQKGHRVSVQPNPECDLFFNAKTEHFGNTVSKDRKKQFAFLKQTIQEYPSSYFLLQQLCQYRAYYTAGELNALVSLFDKPLQEAPTSQKLKTYAAHLLPEGAVFPDVFLLTSDNKSKNVFAENGKLTMLIFWASWCGPCRKEIPEIKKIRDCYPPEDVTIKSISIDENKDKWFIALQEERMNWEQFILPDSGTNKIKAQFRISAVPLVLFFDQHNKELKRMTGYEESNTTKYIRFINEFLKADVKP